MTEVTPGTPGPSVAVDPTAPQPSGAIRLLWWCVILMATLGGPLIFLMIPVFLVAVAVGFFVLVDVFTDRHLTLAQRVIGGSLVVAIVPAALIGAAVADALGAFNQRPSTEMRVLSFAAAILAAIALLWVRPRAWQILKHHEWKP